MPAREVRCVVPAYNEEKNLERVCSELGEAFAALGRPYRLFVVDDGSRDGTAALLRVLAARYPLTPLFHEGNRGIAAAFLTGLRAAVVGAGEDDVVVMLEGDGTSAPSALAAMLAALTPPCDMVIASRYAEGGGYLRFPLKRLLLSRGANGLLRLLCRVRGVRDYTIFYRAYRAGPLSRALAAYGESFTSVGGFACNAEMLLRLRAYVREVREVPFVYDYGLKRGKSSMNIPRNLRSYLELFRIFYLERRGT